MLWPPRSLSVRLFIIVLGGVIMAIAISNTFHHHDRKRIIEEYRQRTAVEHLLDAIRFLAPLPPSPRITAVSVSPPSEWVIEFGSFADNTSGEVAPTFANALADRVADVAQVEGA